MIHIEISNSYQKGKFRLRIGDIEGCMEESCATLEEVLQNIKEEMEKQI